MGEAPLAATDTNDARRPRSLYAKTRNLLWRIGPPPAPVLTFNRCERCWAPSCETTFASTQGDDGFDTAWLPLTRAPR